MSRDKPQPRAKFNFSTMKLDGIKRIAVPEDDTGAGQRALSAAYAYGRRNGWGFCGAHVEEGGKTYMLIRRIK